MRQKVVVNKGHIGWITPWVDSSGGFVHPRAHSIIPSDFVVMGFYNGNYTISVHQGAFSKEKG